jgi:hypothetical protein
MGVAWDKQLMPTILLEVKHQLKKDDKNVELLPTG